MNLTTEVEARLTNLVEVIYPITEEMCAFKRQNIKYKQNAFVWKMRKQLILLNSTQIELVLNELEKKTAVQC